MFQESGRRPARAPRFAPWLVPLTSDRIRPYSLSPEAQARIVAAHKGDAPADRRIRAWRARTAR